MCSVFHWADAMRFLLILFFISGFPALIYQLIWQRALFSIFGSNIESVTLVVSAFMLGLGLGSLVGGRLASNPKFSPLLIFGLIEVAMGLFGFVSLTVIDTIGAQTVAIGPTQTFLISFVTVLIPTLLMGATLPLLVTYLVSRNGEVGQSVSLLYSVNTWGSAAACFIGAFAIFGALGMRGSINLASSMDLAVGLCALFMVFYARRQAMLENAPTPLETPLRASTAAPLISLAPALLLAGFAGFISLSYEILWTRAFFLSFLGSAFAFPVVLGLFLAGIALGASMARDHIARFEQWIRDYSYLPFAGLFLLANVLAFLTVPLLNHFGVLAAGVCIIAASATFGAFLPLISDLAIRADSLLGRKLSYIYIANIVGSTSGTIITGLWLLDVLSMHEAATALFALGATVIVVLLTFQPNRILRVGGVAATLFAIVPTAWAFSPTLHDHLYETLQARGHGEDPAAMKFANVSETKSGVVAIDEENIVYGTGIYDGRVQINLLDDTNGLFRPSAIAAVHPEPKSVLIIGMSMGAWTQLLANLDTVERVQVVEINRGYSDLIKQYPVVASLLENPKVNITFDDGRRWLRRNPDEKFDVIVANTTFHWRAGASNLLSVEFLEQVKTHLNEDGIYFYNSTGSEAVQRTGAYVFDHAARFANFVFTSQSPLVFEKGRWLDRVGSMTIDGRQVLDLNAESGRARAEEIMAEFDDIGPLNPESSIEPALEFRDSILNRTEGMDLITDNNMGAEWPRLLF